MSDTSPAPAWTCPQCGSEYAEPTMPCPVCTGLGWPTQPGTLPPGPQIHIGTLMLLIAGIAVALGIVVAVGPNGGPVLVLLGIPATVAMIRTLLGPNGRWGRPPTTWDHLWTFLRYYLATVAVLIASAIAFFVSCSAVLIVLPPRGTLNSFGIGLIVGALAGLATLIASTAAAIRHWWRSRREFPAGRWR